MLATPMPTTVKYYSSLLFKETNTRRSAKYRQCKNSEYLGDGNRNIFDATPNLRVGFLHIGGEDSKKKKKKQDIHIDRVKELIF